MSAEVELDPSNYHLLLMIERMQRDGRSEAAIERAVRAASASKSPAMLPAAHEAHPGERHSTAAGRR